MRTEAYTVNNVPFVKQGDDLTDFLREEDLHEGDIVVIASTIVSKAEGLARRLDSFNPSDRACRIAAGLNEDPRFIEAVLGQSAEILIEKPFLLVESKFGQVCVNAGLDRSNVEEGFVLLLPDDPSKSAQQIRTRINERYSKNVAVVITDTCGRSFREGQTGVGIGFAGIAPMKDWRGMKDLEGKSLEITNEGVGDEIAGLANLMMGEGAGGTPIVIVRGITYEDLACQVFRSKETDVIRKAIKDANMQR
ncbi:MAG: coenzyme F420-0:L-glutamate ligase [Euryarchaeota archaeon]|nr:coenzyme F420-0:L-glutamate ligase [Euryarchaeota archaeon]